MLARRPLDGSKLLLANKDNTNMSRVNHAVNGSSRSRKLLKGTLATAFACSTSLYASNCAYAASGDVLENIAPDEAVLELATSEQDHGAYSYDAIFSKVSNQKTGANAYDFKKAQPYLSADGKSDEVKELSAFEQGKANKDKLPSATARHAAILAATSADARSLDPQGQSLNRAQLKSRVSAAVDSTAKTTELNDSASVPVAAVNLDGQSKAQISNAMDEAHALTNRTNNLQAGSAYNLNLAKKLKDEATKQAKSQINPTQDEALLLRVNAAANAAATGSNNQAIDQSTTQYQYDRNSLVQEPNKVYKSLLASAKTTYQNAKYVNPNADQSSLMLLKDLEIVDGPAIDQEQWEKFKQKELVNFLGQPLTPELLRSLGYALTALYTQDGYVDAEPYLPSQVISDGSIKVGMTVSKLDEIELAANESGVRDSYMEYLLSGVKEQQGNYTDKDELDSAILKLTDLGVFNLHSHLSYTDAYANQAALAIKASDLYENPVSFTAFADNYGTETAGRYRYGGQLDIRNITGSADTLNLFYSRTNEGQNNYSVHYELPINSHPSVLGVTACYSNYELGGAYQPLGAQGNSLSLEAFYREPLVRTLNSKLNFQTGINYTKLEDEFSTFDLSFKKHYVEGYAELSGYKTCENKYYFGLTNRLTYGHIQNDDDFDLGLEGSYWRFNTTYSFIASLADYLNASTIMQIQLSSTALDSNVDFQAGGNHLIAALGSSDLTGDAGIVVRQNFTFFLNEYFALTPHIEASKVYNRDYAEDNCVGTGLALSLNYQGLYAECDYSTVLGSLPEFVEDRGRMNFSVGYTF